MNPLYERTTARCVPAEIEPKLRYRMVEHAQTYALGDVLHNAVYCFETLSRRLNPRGRPWWRAVRGLRTERRTAVVITPSHLLIATTGGRRRSTQVRSALLGGVRLRHSHRKDPEGSGTYVTAPWAGHPSARFYLEAGGNPDGRALLNELRWVVDTSWRD
ncbi:hypothetical protein ACIOMM_34865 [Streptomyces sp. NPDC087908]|uniref:hypothetical protein n=1 Tax=Streptomyces sp. NPDC087908 TaxID=3365820 RepID=UPI0038042B7C